MDFDSTKLTPAILSLVQQILMPHPLMSWMEGLAGAERVGRIARSKNSVLRYGISRYVQSQLPTIPDDWRLYLFPMDTEIVVKGRYKTEPHEEWEIHAPYPEWLVDFLDDDERFNLLLPESDAKLEEVLQQIYEFCYHHDRYKYMVAIPPQVGVKSHGGK